MSTKAKVRFAAGFILTIFLTIIAIFVFSTTSLVAQTATVFYEKKMENCDTPGGTGNTSPCVVGEKCVMSSCGNYCDSDCSVSTTEDTTSQLLGVTIDDIIEEI